MAAKFEPGGTLFLDVFVDRSQALLSSRMLRADENERLKLAPSKTLAPNPD